VILLSENLKESEPLLFSYTAFAGLYFLMTWLALYPSVVFGYFFFLYFPFSFNIFYLLSLIPLFFGLYGIALLSALISTRTGIWVVHKRIVYPKFGTYPFLMKDPQTRAFILKGNIKNFARWLFGIFHLNFLRVFWLRRMGVKIGKNVKLADSTEDEEFIEIGENTFFSKYGGITGHMYDNAYLTILKSVVGKNCIFDHLGGSVGGTIGDNSICKPITVAMKGIVCRGNAIYQGIPPKKIGEYSDLSPADMASMKQKIRAFDKTDFIKEKNAPIKINEIKLFFIKLIIVLGGSLFAIIFPYLYSLFFRTFYSSNNHLLNIALLIPIPIIFLIALALFITGITVFTKLFLVYYNRKADIPEGYYELDDPRAKYFKIKYCLRRFGLRIFDGSPLKIIDTFALRFWGNLKLGKNVKVSDAKIDPQYVEIGDFTQIGQGTRLHTHDIIEGKLYIQTVKIGKNVLIGDYSHIKPGVEIADGSISALGTWFSQNQKCKHRALYLGKPAVEVPIEVVSRSTGAKAKYVD
jgi:acetyltransferase-like isoleucine patch superfamily enzyme